MMTFELIPVIDLRHGQVVHARRGERGSYQPIQSLLTRSTDPVNVALALVQCYQARVLYVADLDAIIDGTTQWPVLARLRAALPQCELWIDPGIGTSQALAQLALADLGVPVLGSESLSDVLVLQGATQSGCEVVLSLDYRDESPLGQPNVHAQANLWPQRIIAMNLRTVGAEAGPDFSLIGQLQMRAGGRRVFAAGGVRGRQDIERLQGAGVAGALCATALHNGALAGHGS